MQRRNRRKQSKYDDYEEGIREVTNTREKCTCLIGPEDYEECIDKWTLGVASNDNDLKEEALETIGKEIMELIRKRQFAALSQEALCELLQQDEMHENCSEFELVLVAICWFIHQETDVEAMEIFQYINLELIDADLLTHFFKPDRDCNEHDSNFARLINTIESSVFLAKSKSIIGISTKPQMLFKLCDLEGQINENSLQHASEPKLDNIAHSIVVGTNLYVIEKLGSQRMYCFNTDKKRWRRLADLKMGACGRSATYVLYGTIHLVGGIQNGNAHNHVYAYHVLLNRWKREPDFPIAAYDQSACVSEANNIYVIGGRKLDKVHLRCVHKSADRCKSWSKIGDLEIAVSSNATFITKSSLWVVGGLANGQTSNSIYEYGYGKDEATQNTLLPLSEITLPNTVTPMLSYKGDNGTIFFVCDSQLMKFDSSSKKLSVVRKNLPADPFNHLAIISMVD